MMPCECDYTSKNVLGRFLVIHRRKRPAAGCLAHDDNETTIHIQMGAAE